MAQQAKRSVKESSGEEILTKAEGEISTENEKLLQSTCLSLAFLEIDSSIVKMVKDYVDRRLLELAWYTLKHYGQQAQEQKGIKVEAPNISGKVAVPSVGKVVQEAFVVAKVFNADKQLLSALEEVNYKKVLVWTGKKEKQLYKLLAEAQIAEQSSDIYEVYITPELKTLRGYEVRMKEKDGESLLLGTFPNMKLAKLFFDLLEEHNQKLMEKKK